MGFNSEDDYDETGNMPNVVLESEFHVNLPSDMKTPETFLLYNEETKNYQPVRCLVDPLGMFFICNKNDGSCVDLVHALEVRYKHVATCDALGKLSWGNAVELGFSITYGTELYPKQYLFVIAKTEEKAKSWVKHLSQLVNTTRLVNPSFSLLILREYYRLTCISECVGRLNIKHLLESLRCGRNEKFFIQTLQNLNLIDPTQPNIINQKNFNLATLHKYYAMCERGLFLDMIKLTMSGSDDPNVTYDDFKNFVDTVQSDSAMLSYFEDSKTIYRDCETNQTYIERGLLSNEGILNYVFSKHMSAVEAVYRPCLQDMTLPLAQYFINSSHNTYLTGRQYYGTSSTEMYRYCLLSGCRCIELDCWDGSEDEPIITHGKAMCTNILFKDALHSIKDSAFITSPYPVILSLENHCSFKQQLKIAGYLKEVLGTNLLSEPLLDYPLKPGVQFPSPEALKGKILIKNKKLSSINELNAIDRLAIIEGSVESMGKGGESTNVNSMEDKKRRECHSYMNVDIGSNATPASTYDDAYSNITTSSNHECDLTCSIRSCDPKQLYTKDCSSMEGDLMYHDSAQPQYKTLAGLKSVDKKKKPVVVTASEQYKRRSKINMEASSRCQSVDSRIGAMSLSNKGDDETMTSCENATNPTSSTYPTTSSTSNSSMAACRRITYCNSSSRQVQLENVSFTSRSSTFISKMDTNIKKGIKSIFKAASLASQPVDRDSGSVVSSSFSASKTIKGLTKKKEKGKRANESIDTTQGPQKYVISGPSDFRVIDPTLTIEEVVGGKDIYIPASEYDDSRYCSSPSFLGGTVGGENQGITNLCNAMGNNDPSLGGTLSHRTDEVMVSNEALMKGCTFESEPWEESDYSFDEDDDSIDDDLPLSRESGNEIETKKKRCYKIHPYLSCLVNYARPAPLARFNKKDNSLEEEYYLKVTSLNENAAEKYIKEYPNQFISYCQKSLVRVYPKAKRLDSSNYNPQIFWNAGCQLAALNFQTPDIPFQYNCTRFETNARYGYVLKPAFLRETNDSSNAKFPTNRKPLQLKLTIISAIFVIDSTKPEIYCVVETFGRQSDTKYRKVKVAENSAHCVNFESDQVIFDSIQYLDCTYIRFAVMEKNTCHAQRILLASQLRKGFRYIPLRNASNQQLPLAILCVYVDILRANR